MLTAASEYSVMSMPDDCRSMNLSKINRVIAGVLLTLLAASVTGVYVVRDEIEAIASEHSRRSIATRQQLTVFGSLISVTSAAANRSKDRLMQAGLLDFGGNPTRVDRPAAARCHNMSLEGREAAMIDLAVLAKFPAGLPQAGEMLQRHVAQLLREEADVWQNIDLFLERTAARQSDEGGLQAVDHALIEYRRLNRTHAEALSKADDEFFRIDIKENYEIKRSFEGALVRSGVKLKWSGLGLAAASLALPSYFFYLLWLSLKSKWHNKKLIVAGRQNRLGSL